jgi:hypothetical protein
MAIGCIETGAQLPGNLMIGCSFQQLENRDLTSPKVNFGQVFYTRYTCALPADTKLILFIQP